MITLFLHISTKSGLQPPLKFTLIHSYNNVLPRTENVRSYVTFSQRWTLKGGDGSLI